MGRQLNRETCVAEATENRVVMSQGCRAGRSSGLHQADGPGMPGKHRSRRLGPLPHRRLPVGADGRQFDLAENDVDHPVEDVVLVGHVVVQRHGLDAHLLRESAHGERPDSFSVGESNRDLQRALPAEWDTRHVDNLTT